MSATLETMPRVTDWESPAGLPMAKHTSPISTLSESPKLATVRGLLFVGRSSILRRSTARSVIGSAPNKSAITSSPLCSLQVILVALPATWWFVTTRPSLEIMTPLPVALDFIIRPLDPCSDTTSIRTMAGYTFSTASARGRAGAF